MNIIYNFHFEVKLRKYVVLRRKGRLGVFYKRDVDITLRVSDCEELVGGFTGDDGGMVLGFILGIRLPSETLLFQNYSQKPNLIHYQLI